jgi:hypothetical protein
VESVDGKKKAQGIFRDYLITLTFELAEQAKRGKHSNKKHGCNPAILMSHGR